MEQKSVTTVTLKKINKSKVYQYIYEQKSTSKFQIVRDLHMGLSTVSQNLNTLEQEGLIKRNGYFDSTGGRKAQIIQIVSDLKISIGVGLLKDMFHIVAVNLYGEALCMDTFQIPYQNTDAYYQQVADTIQKYITQKKYKKGQILGISFATQGITSPDGTAMTYGIIMGNSEMKLSDFSSRLPYPCRLEHDSKAAALLELWNHRYLDSALILLLNRNLGGAVITNHRLHQGTFMHSGTIEHICICPDGPLCYCGNHGCLETYCSANALEAAAGLPIREFFPALREGSSIQLKQIWSDYLKNLASVIRTLNLVIDCPIIISGYLAPYFTEEDLLCVLEQVNRTIPFPLHRDQLLVGAHGQYTPAIGAALFYTEQFIRSIS